MSQATADESATSEVKMTCLTGTKTQDSWYFQNAVRGLFVSTKHDLSEAAVDKLLEMLGNVCTSFNQNRSKAAPATCEVEWSSAYDLYYILVLPMNIPLSHIITWPVITCYYCFCYFTVITTFLRIIAYFIITYYCCFCYYTVIASLLHIITSFIITYYHCICNYTVITSLLRIITYSLLPIITTSLLRIFTSLLRHCYVIVTSLLPMAETGKNELMITYYALHCYYLLLPLLPIITYYQQDNLQMQRLDWNLDCGFYPRDTVTSKQIREVTLPKPTLFRCRRREGLGRRPASSLRLSRTSATKRKLFFLFLVWCNHTEKESLLNHIAEQNSCIEPKRNQANTRGC